MYHPRCQTWASVTALQHVFLDKCLRRPHDGSLSNPIVCRVTWRPDLVHSGRSFRTELSNTTDELTDTGRSICSDGDFLAPQSINPFRKQACSVWVATSFHRNGCSEDHTSASVLCNHRWCGISAEVTVVGKHSGSVTITVTTLCQVTSLQSPTHDRTDTKGEKARETHHALLVQLSLGFAVPQTRVPSPPCQSPPLQVRQGQQASSMSTSARSEASVTGRRHACFSCAPQCVALQALFLDAVRVQPCL